MADSEVILLFFKISKGVNTKVLSSKANQIINHLFKDNVKKIDIKIKKKKNITNGCKIKIL